MLALRLRTRGGFFCQGIRHYSRLSGSHPDTKASDSATSSATATGRLADDRLAASLAREVASINSRLECMSLTSQYLAGRSLLTSQPAGHTLLSPQPTTLKLPSQRNVKIESPLPQPDARKTFITEEKVEIKDPRTLSRIDEPITKRIKKHAIRMVLLRRKKMRKHRRKRLWDRMYLKFRANRITREKKKEIEFRGRLAAKIEEARKFSAEDYVKQYLHEFNTELVPGTYKGKRLPSWLIIELLEQDKQIEKDKMMEGKTYTTKETIVKPGETVQQFIQRTWSEPKNNQHRN